MRFDGTDEIIPKRSWFMKELKSLSLLNWFAYTIPGRMGQLVNIDMNRWALWPLVNYCTINKIYTVAWEVEVMFTLCT